MTLLHCLACDDLRVVAEGVGKASCACSRSVADLRDGEIQIHGPCRVLWIGETTLVSTVVGSPAWPIDAPRVQRKAVPPLI